MILDSAQQLAAFSLHETPTHESTQQEKPQIHSHLKPHFSPRYIDIDVIHSTIHLLHTASVQITGQ